MAAAFGAGAAIGGAALPAVGTETFSALWQDFHLAESRQKAEESTQSRLRARLRLLEADTAEAHSQGDAARAEHTVRLATTKRILDKEAAVAAELARLKESIRRAAHETVVAETEAERVAGKHDADTVAFKEALASALTTRKQSLQRLANLASADDTGPELKAAAEALCAQRTAEIEQQEATADEHLIPSADAVARVVGHDQAPAAAEDGPEGVLPMPASPPSMEQQQPAAPHAHSTPGEEAPQPEPAELEAVNVDMVVIAQPELQADADTPPPRPATACTGEPASTAVLAPATHTYASSPMPAPAAEIAVLPGPSRHPDSCRPSPQQLPVVEVPVLRPSNSAAHPPVPRPTHNAIASQLLREHPSPAHNDISAPTSPAGLGHGFQSLAAIMGSNLSGSPRRPTNAVQRLVRPQPTYPPPTPGSAGAITPDAPAPHTPMVQALQPSPATVTIQASPVRAFSLAHHRASPPTPRTTAPSTPVAAKYRALAFPEPALGRSATAGFPDRLLATPTTSTTAATAGPQYPTSTSSPIAFATPSWATSYPAPGQGGNMGAPTTPRTTAAAPASPGATFFSNSSLDDSAAAADQATPMTLF